MDACKIYDILEKFASNDQRGILIDGSWGIGKTYQINRFLKKVEEESKKEKRNSEKSKIIYSSLFGLDSIADLHTELFAKLNPFANVVKNAVGVISPAFSLIPHAGEAVSSTVSYAIGKIDDSIRKPKQRTKQRSISKRVIIILDDIERVGPNFDYSALLGYINQAYLSGLKVVCICDATRIKNESFDELKEKVFDRYYRVTKANEDIIKMYFAEDEVFLDSETIELFANNLRTASKSAKFYNEVKNHLASLDANKYRPIKSEHIPWYVSLIVTSLNQKLQMTDNQKTTKENDSSYSFFNSYFKDEDLSNRLSRCLRFDSNSNHSKEFFHKGYFERRYLFLALSFAYLYDDYSFLDNLLVVRDEVYDSYNPLFYLSAERRVEEIKKIIKNIDTIDVLNERRFNKVLSIFSWEETKTIEYDEEAIIQKMAEKCLKAKEIVTNAFDFLSHYPEKEQKILLKIYDAYRVLLKKELISELEKNFSLGNYDQMDVLLKEIKQKDYSSSNNNVYYLAPELEDCFIRNKYFLPTLSGTIREEDWLFAHSICRSIADFSITKNFSSYLVEIKESTRDSDERMRVIELLKKYYPKILLDDKKRCSKLGYF